MATLFRTFDQTMVVEEGPDETLHRDRPAYSDLSASARARHWDYFGKSSNLRFGPEAYLVELDAHRIVRAHYHSVDQFQLMYGGAGATYKRTEVPDLLLHYTDAYTTYGPFAAGDERFRFLTLRPTPSDLTAFMPESRGLLPPPAKKRRHVLFDLTPMITGDLPQAEARVEVAMTDADGLPIAHLVSAGPGATLTLPAALGRGSYVVPITGAMVDGNAHRYAALSVGWMGQPRDEGGGAPYVRVRGAMRADVTGCRVLVMHF